MGEGQKTTDQAPGPGQEKMAATAPGNGQQRSFWRRRPVVVVGTIALAVGLFFVLGYIAESLTHETTDDAFLDAHVVAIAPKVAGLVQRVPVADNQPVEAGQLLVQLDPRDLQVALDQKKAAVNAAHAETDLLAANLEVARAQVVSTEATAKQTAAEAAAAQATSERAQADLKRAQELIANHTISPQEFDTARAVASAADANLRAAQEKASSDKSKIAEAQAEVAAAQKALDRGESQTRQAELDVRAAELNLSYAGVVAPEAGRVAKRAVQPGDYVQIGQNLLALVPVSLYVTANFKETQLAKIRTNQPVLVAIDALGGKTFNAHVDSVMAGSGARFSLLPPENAVGNYVKVVQRVPVKIEFDTPLQAGQVLGPGMSVVPSVHVSGAEIPQVALAVAAIVLALVVGFFWWRKSGPASAMK